MTFAQPLPFCLQERIWGNSWEISWEIRNGTQVGVTKTLSVTCNNVVNP